MDLPSIHFSPFHVATCEIDLCAATVHAFLVKIPEPLTRTLDWLAGGLEREDDMGDGEPAAGRFPLSPCLVHFRFHLTRRPLVVATIYSKLATDPSAVTETEG